MSSVYLRISDPDLIHPEDLSRWDNHKPNHCWIFPPPFSNDDDFVPIEVRKEYFRVKPAALRVIDDTAFSIGQCVRTTNGTHRVGWVYDMVWHHNLKRYHFYIEVQGTKVPRQRVSRRYSEADLEAVD